MSKEQMRHHEENRDIVAQIVAKWRRHGFLTDKDQQQPVRVVNFVAHGTIEHGMLDVLKFKKSMFTGVLDGGEDEVFLGGTRLKCFMESVEGVTEKIPTPMPVESSEKAGGEDVDVAVPDADVAEKADEVPVQDVWSEAITAGLSFLTKLADVAASNKPNAEGLTAPAGLSSMVERDDKTGRSYLKFPMPEPEVLNKIADLLKSISRR